VATQEMRADFDEMAARNKRPKDYRLKVRTHSGLLSITSASKMRLHEKIQVGFSGAVKQTYEFPRDPVVIKKNWEAVKELIASLPAPNTSQPNKLFWIGDLSDAVIGFLESYQTEQPNIRQDILGGYIRKQLKKGNLTGWAVAIRSNTQPEATVDVEFNGRGLIAIGLTERGDVGKGKFYELSKQNIQDPPDTYFDLNLKPEKAKSSVSKKLVHQARAESGRGLLVIYPLDPAKIEGVGGFPVTGFYLAFPKIANEELVEFAAQVKPGFEDAQEDDDNDEEV